MISLQRISSRKKEFVYPCIIQPENLSQKLDIFNYLIIYNIIFDCIFAHTDYLTASGYGILMKCGASHELPWSHRHFLVTSTQLWVTSFILGPLLLFLQLCRKGFECLLSGNNERWSQNQQLQALWASFSRLLWHFEFSQSGWSLHRKYWEVWVNLEYFC